MYENNLPAPRTIRKWFESINGSPGYSKEALLAIKMKMAEASSKNKTLLCCLMMDEMSIRKHVQLDAGKKKFVGYVDFGGAIADRENFPVAKEALVLMITAVNDHWKIPFAYFLINGLTSTEKASIINDALVFLHESNVNIISLVFDGAANNICMMKKLVQNEESNDFIMEFRHPSTNKPIYTLLDICHILKLVRNTLASQTVLIDPDSNEINWKYIEMLEEVQDFEGIRLANKLAKRHIDW